MKRKFGRFIGVTFEKILFGLKSQLIKWGTSLELMYVLSLNLELEITKVIE